MMILRKFLSKFRYSIVGEVKGVCYVKRSKTECVFVLSENGFGRRRCKFIPTGFLAEYAHKKNSTCWPQVYKWLKRLEPEQPEESATVLKLVK